MKTYQWIENEKEDLHKQIRKKRNNLIDLLNESKGMLPMFYILQLNEYKTLLDTIDYILDKGVKKDDGCE